MASSKQGWLAVSAGLVGHAAKRAPSLETAGSPDRCQQKEARMNREEQLEPYRLGQLKSDLVPVAERPRQTLLCLSHLRWGFVYQRHQQLMYRLAVLYAVLHYEGHSYDCLAPALTTL